jgi:hypothetical protein
MTSDTGSLKEKGERQINSHTGGVLTQSISTAKLAVLLPSRAADATDRAAPAEGREELRFKSSLGLLFDSKMQT